MKKLALALVCIASLAFFASCNKEGQPTIQVYNGEDGYVLATDTVNVNTEVNFGFVVASSAVTNKELSTLVVKVDDYDELTDTINLAGMTSYTYKGTLSYTAKDEIVGTSVITAIVTDAAGQTATASINLTIIQPDQPLISKTVEWIRKGTNFVGITEAEMREIGLEWTGNFRAPMVTIVPLDGAQLYVCSGDDYADIATISDKNAYFTSLHETGTAVESYRNITTNNSADYNDMLAVIYGEKLTLVRINRAEIETGNYGTQVTIKGEMK